MIKVKSTAKKSKNINARAKLHELLDQACNECKEGEFVAPHFTQLCMEELRNANQIQNRSKS